MNIALLLARVAAWQGERPAVSLGMNVRLDYRALARRAAVLGGALRDRFRLPPGERVGIFMSNGAEYPEVLFAIWSQGLVAVPINAKLHAREAAWILDNAGARICFASPDHAEEISPLADELDLLDRAIVTGSPAYERLFQGEAAEINTDVGPEDLAWLFYTSGTTGRPKGAMLSHRNLMVAAVNYFADVDGVDPGDAIVHAAPMSHGGGFCGLSHLAKGANQVIPESGGFDPAECLDLIRRWPGTSFFFAPTMVHRLIHCPAIGQADTRHLKTIVYGGGPMYVEDMLAAIEVLGPRFAQIYGQGEAPMTITGLPKWLHADRSHPRYLERLASVGIARTDVEVRVADAEDRTLPPGETGEVLARGAVIMQGYWRNEAASAETLRGGWLHTGDVGSLDGQGFLTLKDRAKDLIISGGSNIYPREIEEVLLRHPAVSEASVVGRPHPDWGEEVVAFVVAAPGRSVSPAELDALLLDHIARFKRPKLYRLVESLPKNNYGKVLKTELRRILAAPDATG